MEVIGKDELFKLIDGSGSLDELKQTIEATEKSEIETLELYEGDVVIIMFSEFDGVPELVQRLQDMYPENPIMAIDKNMDVLIQESEEALEMLDGMKAKINIMRGTSSGKIII